MSSNEELLVSLKVAYDEIETLKAQVQRLQDDLKVVTETDTINQLKKELADTVETKNRQNDELAKELSIQKAFVTALRDTPMAQLKNEAAVAYETANVAMAECKKALEERDAAVIKATQLVRDLKKEQSAHMTTQETFVKYRELNDAEHTRILNVLNDTTTQVKSLQVKQFYAIGADVYFVLNADPSDMEFIESERPWVATKYSTGCYLLRITNPAARQVLHDLGYELRQKSRP
jgi:hypothetical protein